VKDGGGRGGNIPIEGRGIKKERERVEKGNGELPRSFVLPGRAIYPRRESCGVWEDFFGAYFRNLRPSFVPKLVNLTDSGLGVVVKFFYQLGKMPARGTPGLFSCGFKTPGSRVV